MKFYLIKGVKRQQPEYCGIRMLPEGTQHLAHKMGWGRVMGDDYPDDARINMSERHPDSLVVTDFIANTDSIMPVSSKMKEIIESFCANVEIEYLPFTLLNHKGRVAATDYYIVNVIGALDCVDLEASTVRWSKKCPGEIVSIKKYVLDAEKLKDAPHLFRIKEDPCEYVVSEELANAFKAAKLTNINLDEVEVK